ncbi:sporulation protein [Pseudacidovorax sp. RU35E]|uniref:sporulation protein n=1 Tax=Pseudacidovorax sp. RU35E TaxID=1907403 RepID=UPI0009571403|nr:sporulation protein [Pseudacidovorax sp. RU35E]SIQ69810.1 hypothetical protein SAMN05880557_105115 [Pseudacidovorax sp. RU35E]
MLLRLCVLALLLANAGYFLWARGDLAGFGWAPASLHEREPQRLNTQIRPELLEVRPAPADAPAAEAPESASSSPAR